MKVATVLTMCIVMVCLLQTVTATTSYLQYDGKRNYPYWRGNYLWGNNYHYLYPQGYGYSYGNGYGNGNNALWLYWIFSSKEHLRY